MIDYRSLPKSKIIQGIRKLGELETAGGLTTLERQELETAREELISRVTDARRRIRDTQFRIHEKTGQNIPFDSVLIKLAENEEEYRRSLGEKHANEQAAKKAKFQESGRISANKLSR